MNDEEHGTWPCQDVFDALLSCTLGSEGVAGGSLTSVMLACKTVRGPYCAGLQKMYWRSRANQADRFLLCLS